MPHAPRILLVEDDADTRDVLVQVLRDEAFEVDAVDNFDDARQRLHARDISFVLSDFCGQRPRKDGPSAWAPLERLRQAAQPAKMGIVTGWPVDEKEVAVRGFQFALKKPFNLEDLLTLVATHAKGTDPRPEHVDAIHRYFNALSTQNWEALGKLCTQNMHYHLPSAMAPFVPFVEGRLEFQKYAAATFGRFPGASFKVEAVVPLPNALIGRYLGRWTGANGKAMELGGSVLFHFQGALISQVGVRLEMAKLLQTIGG